MRETLQQSSRSILGDPRAATQHEVVVETVAVPTRHLEGHGDPGIASDVPELVLVEERADDHFTILGTDPRHRDVRRAVRAQSHDVSEWTRLDELEDAG